MLNFFILEVMIESVRSAFILEVEELITKSNGECKVNKVDDRFHDVPTVGNISAIASQIELAY